MSQVWVKAGQCNHETSVAACRMDMTHVAGEFVTTCKHIQNPAEVLKSLNIAHEMSTILLETEVYRTAKNSFAMTVAACQRRFSTPWKSKQTSSLPMNTFL